MGLGASLCDLRIWLPGDLTHGTSVFKNQPPVLVKHKTIPSEVIKYYLREVLHCTMQEDHEREQLHHISLLIGRSLVIAKNHLQWDGAVFSRSKSSFIRMHECPAKSLMLWIPLQQMFGYQFDNKQCSCENLVLAPVHPSLPSKNHWPCRFQASLTLF